jgi:hypothetical protein
MKLSPRVLFLAGPPRPSPSGRLTAVMKMIRFPVPATLFFLALIFFAGCSKEQIHGSAFESMRHISNQENARNPNYDAERVGDYGQYKARRDEYLRERKKAGE